MMFDSLLIIFLSIAQNHFFSLHRALKKAPIAKAKQYSILKVLHLFQVNNPDACLGKAHPAQPRDGLLINLHSTIASGRKWSIFSAQE